jgi:RNA polymerase sigma factor (sigma-70 family)
MIFPTTRHSVVLAAKSADPGVQRPALEVLVGGYWRPVYTYLRLRWRQRPEDAEDATQEFFARALDKGWLTAYDPAKARFRTYLRTCLDGFAANRHKAAGRRKRGAGVAFVGLDFTDAEGGVRERELPADVDLEELFHREWVRALFAQALAELEAWCAEAGKPLVWEAFRRYDLAGSADGSGRPSYAEVGLALGLPVTQVTNFLHLARRELRRLVRERLARLCATAAEAAAEEQAIFGGGRGA